jgi:uncharacterized protein
MSSAIFAHLGAYTWARVVKDTSFIPGLVCWIGVSSTDPAGSREFYAGLFGWTYQISPGHRHDTIALCAGQPVASLAGVAVPAAQPVTWTLYLASADIDHTATVFTQWGGRVLQGPVDVPGQGKVLIGADPTGAVIGFWQPATPWSFHTAPPGRDLGRVEHLAWHAGRQGLRKSVRLPPATDRRRP